MNRLVATGAVTPVDSAASVDVVKQLVDNIRGLAADISQVISEYNQEVQPILGTLPQGKKDTRWSLPDNTINPRVNDLDGANIFVDTDASTTADGGYYWDSTRNRPLTIKEALSAIRTELGNGLDSVRSEFTTSVAGSGGLTAAQEARIGANIFDGSVVSSALSLDGLTASNYRHLVQLARDIYNDAAGVGWSWTSDGSGLRVNYTLREELEALLLLHDGALDSDITLNHDGVGASKSYTAGTNEETVSTSEVIVGGFSFDPTQFGTAISSITLYFEGLLYYLAAGAVGTGYLYLYDMGSPGSVGAGVLRSTLSPAGRNSLYRERNQLTTTVAPGVNTNTIYNVERIYEIRIKTSGAGAITDKIRMIWGGITAFA